MRGFLICVYDGNELYRFELADCDAMELREKDCPALKNNRLTFSSNGGEWRVIADKPIKLKDVGEVTSNTLMPGQIYKIPSGASFGVYPLQDDGSIFTVGAQDVIKIGRGAGCQIRINNSQVSALHCEIRKHDGGYTIADCRSANGTYINGRKIQETALSDGDIVQILGYEIVFAGHELRFRNTGSDLTIGAASAQNTGHGSQPPLFTRSPRLRKAMPSGEINISPPPAQAVKPEINWLPIILQPIITVGMTMLVTVLVSMNSAAGFNPFMGLTSLSFAIGSVTVSVLSYRKQIKKHAAKETERVDKYIGYLSEAAAKLAREANTQREVLTGENSDPRVCARIVSERQRRLWERTARDDDFMSVRLGLADVPAAVTVNLRDTGFTMQEDELQRQCEKLKEAYTFTPDVPVTLDLADNAIVGFVGGRTELSAICRNIIIQLTTQHGYDDVKLVLFFPENENGQWAWVRWLPHMWDDDRTVRFIADNKRDARKLSDIMRDIMKRREGRSASSFAPSEPPLPRFVCIVADMALPEGEEIAKYLVSGNKELGLTTLFLADSFSRLPGGCSAIVECRGQLMLRQGNDKSDKTEITPDGITEREAEAFARSLAPIRLKRVGNEVKFPSRLTFLQGYGVKKPDELCVVSRWREAEPHESLAVPIGVMPSGKTFSLDLRENEGAHGPHGLVAGMSGFGKSELLQTLVLSLAVNFHPHDMTFVLIDFRGGGMANQLAGLPHTVGIITNIDGDITRLLVSIRAENERRLRLFSKAGVNHIDKYQRKYKNEENIEQLARLVLIADEFAELKKEKPDFVRELVALSRVGRSQGIHLILATQKPGGVVDEQIWANSRFKLCLKVASEADSKEMLRSPEAAALSTPGRAYVRVGQDEVFEMFQSYWSGAPYDAASFDAVPETEACLVELNGRRLRPDISKKAHSELDELKAISRHITEIAEKAGIKRLQGPWLEDLPPRMFLPKLYPTSFDGKQWTEQQRGVFAPVIGMFDNPSVPSQGLLCVDFVKDGHLCVFGATGTGKSVFLQTLIASAAESYSPDKVQFYLLDFGGRGMRVFSHLPHTGEVLYDDDSEKIAKFTKIITAEMDSRKKLFEETDTSNFEGYSYVGDMPAIIVIVDNVTAMTELFPDSESLLTTIAREGVTLGIYLVVTAGTFNGVRYRISQNMKQAIAFQMTDKGDLTSIVGRGEGISMPSLPGRGLMRGTPPLLFQTALISDAASQAEQAILLRERFSVMDSAWNGARPKKIPVMRERVSEDELLGFCSEKRLPIGISMEVEPVYFDFNKGHCFLISAVSNGERMLSFLMKAALRLDGGSRFYVFDGLGEKLLGINANVESYLTLTQENEAAIEQVVYGIIEELTRRKNSERETEKMGTPLSAHTPWYIIISDIKECFAAITDNTLDGLERIVHRANGLGVYVIAAGSPDGIQSKLLDRHFVEPMTKCGQCAAIGGTATTHSFLGVDMINYDEKKVPLLSDEGWLISNGSALRFKYAI